MTEYFICLTDDLSDPGSRGFSVKTDQMNIEGFVVSKDGQFYAYQNSCPHTGAPLDWVEHQFLDLDGIQIQCAVHDARFLIDTGLCVAGPCSGQSLLALTVTQQGGQLFLKVN